MNADDSVDAGAAAQYPPSTPSHILGDTATGEQSLHRPTSLMRKALLTRFQRQKQQLLLMAMKFKARTT